MAPVTHPLLSIAVAFPSHCPVFLLQPQGPVGYLKYPRVLGFEMLGPAARSLEFEVRREALTFRNLLWGYIRSSCECLRSWKCMEALFRGSQLFAGLSGAAHEVWAVTVRTGDF